MLDPKFLEITKLKSNGEVTPMTFEEFIKELPELNDPVNHPSHYTSGTIEVIDYIEDKGLNYNLGNAVKYISRAGKKASSPYEEDLKKAIWYLNRELSKIKEA